MPQRFSFSALPMGFLFVLAWPLLCTGQLQHSVEQALPAFAGTIVVVDVASDKILAAKNLHLAAQELVRPGSTLKPFVLSVLLQKKRIDSKEKLVRRRPLRIGSLRMDCSHSNLVTQLNAEDAIAYSCNSNNLCRFNGAGSSAPTLGPNRQ